MILENAFTTASDMVDHFFPIISFFKKFIVRIYWPSIDRIKTIRVPILFIVGSSDDIIPPSQTDQLFETAYSSIFKHKYIVQGGSHNDTWIKGGKDYMFAIKDFFDKAYEYNKS